MSKRTAMDIADALEVEMPTLKNMDYAASVLRRQHAEIGRLARKNAAYASLTKAQDAELSLHRDRAAAYHASVKNIDSEREVNAILTAEREACAAEIERLRAQVKRLRDALVGVVADDDVNGLRFTAAVIESMDCDDATVSLAAIRALIDIRPEGSAGEEKP